MEYAPVSNEQAERMVEYAKKTTAETLFEE